MLTGALMKIRLHYNRMCLLERPSIDDSGRVIALGRHQLCFPFLPLWSLYKCFRLAVSALDQLCLLATINQPNICFVGFVFPCASFALLDFYQWPWLWLLCLASKFHKSWQPTTTSWGKFDILQTGQQQHFLTFKRQSLAHTRRPVALTWPSRSAGVCRLYYYQRFAAMCPYIQSACLRQSSLAWPHAEGLSGNSER